MNLDIFRRKRINNAMKATTRFTDNYLLKEELGRGAFSIVRRCIQVRTKKCLSRSQPDST